MIKNAQEGLAWLYLPKYDAEFLIKAVEEIERLDDYNLQQLVELLFEAVKNASEGVTYDIPYA